MLYVESKLAFRRNMSPPSSVMKSKPNMKQAAIKSPLLFGILLPWRDREKAKTNQSR
jgi:hypothetical protein